MYRKLVKCPKLKEILIEVQSQRVKRNECKRIMDLCSSVQDDTNEIINKINFEVINEKLRVAEFEATLGIVQDLDSNKPEAFPLLYQFKKEDINAQVAMTKEEANYYKSGKNDPSKIAGLEKMQKQQKRKK